MRDSYSKAFLKFGLGKAFVSFREKRKKITKANGCSHLFSFLFVLLSHKSLGIFVMCQM